MKTCRKSARAIFIGIICLMTASCRAIHHKPEKTVDVVLIGGGIMSASVGSLLNDLEPGLSVEIFERLDAVAKESSAAWNNAGTGHSGYCELNYTPENQDGTINTDKAVRVNEAFEVSRQYWAYLVKTGGIQNPRSFIRNVPHMNLVMGEKDVEFLKKRFNRMKKNILFSDMVYSEDPKTIKKWAPLIMEGRSADQKVAATRVAKGTEVNFGAVTQSMFAKVLKNPQARISYSHEVSGLEKSEEGYWNVMVKNLKDGKKKLIKSKFLFIGAGGGALPLLQKTNIPEARKYGGLPVGGEFLVSDNPDVVRRHTAKVYGKASIGAPPMSVAHLDTRVIDGKKTLLFGPFARFDTRYLKNGSYSDILKSLSIHTVGPMIKVGFKNTSLIKYLIKQVLLSKNDKVEILKNYYPQARPEQWRQHKAGQRVQIIKSDESGSYLRFGTEIVSSQDGSVVALLGASPGASVSVKIAVDVLKAGFKERFRSEKWRKKIREMIPSFEKSLSGNPELHDQVQGLIRSHLNLEF